MRLSSPHINLITKACLKASRPLIRDYGEIENLQVSKKAPGDFVSSADKRTEKILIEELQKAHPDYGIITEETGLINKSSYVIANDTGPAHMTAHLGKKGTVIFGHHTTPEKVSIETQNFKPITSTNLNILKAE